MVEQPKAAIKKKVTIQPQKKVKPVEVKNSVQKKIVEEEPIEEEVPENSTQIDDDDEVIDLEEETRSLLEEDVEEDIEA